MTDNENQRIAELELKLNEAEAALSALQAQNSSLARANAGSAELLAELEIRGEEIHTLNQTLARANAGAAELMAELELNQAEMERLNGMLLGEKERLSIILGSIGDGIIATDPHGRIELFNSKAESLTGWNQTEITGKNLDELLRFQSKEGTAIPSLMNLFDERAASCLGEIWILTQQGQRTPVEVSLAIIRDSGGHASGAVYVFRDRTEQQKAEQLKEEFLSSMTHDLKSPLNSLNGFIDLMASPAYGDISKAKLEFLDWMKYSATMLLDLINNLIENSKINAGKMTYHFENFSLTALIEELKGTFKPQSISGLTTLDFSSSGEIFVYADRQRIRQVFHNLIGNALRFTPQDGVISVRAFPQNGHIAVEVADTGKGIPQAEQGKLFTRFCDIKGEKRGTGLGLFNVKTFLNAHNSGIMCESEPGKGTRFQFALPCGSNVQEALPARSRLLLLGEDIDVLQLIELILKDDGHTVEFAMTGVHGLQLFTAFKPDVIVIVEPLPDMPPETFRYLVVKELREQVPILLLSHHHRTGREKLFNQVIPLPFEKPVFRNALAHALGFWKQAPMAPQGQEESHMATDMKESAR